MKYVKRTSTGRGSYSRISGTCAPKLRAAPKAAPDRIQEASTPSSREVPEPDLRSTFEKYRASGYLRGRERAKRDRLIREEYLKGGRTYEQLAKETGLSIGIVSVACRGSKGPRSKRQKPGAGKGARKPKKKKAHGEKKRERYIRTPYRVEDLRSPDEVAECILERGVYSPIFEDGKCRRFRRQTVKPAQGVSKMRLKEFLARRFRRGWPSLSQLQEIGRHYDAARAAEKAGLARITNSGFLDLFWSGPRQLS